MYLLCYLFLLLPLLNMTVTSCRKQRIPPKKTYQPAIIELSVPPTYGCEFVNSNSSVYAKLGMSCPLRQLQTKSYYYSPLRGMKNYRITYYYRPVPENHLFCDGTCNGQGFVGSRHNRMHTVAHTYRSAVDTVIRDVPTLKAWWRERRRNVGARRRLPWCDHDTVGMGHWIPRELLSHLVVSRHPQPQPQPQPQQQKQEQREREQEREFEDVLREVMGGDVAVALTWRYVWVPSRCQLFHYNISSFTRCAREWRQRTNTTLWIYFLGDSTSLATFCSLLRLLSPGGECDGGTRAEPCYHNFPFNAIISDQHPIATEYSYVCPSASLYLSCHPFLDAASPFVDLVVPGLMKVPRGPGVYGPSHLVYNTGTWDHWIPMKLRVHGDKKGNHTWMEYPIQPPPLGLTLDHEVVDRERPKQVRNLLRVLQQQPHRFQGRFIYRSNYCNAQYEARAADEGVEAVVREEGGVVLNVYNASTCRGTALLRDAMHVDRRHARRPPPEKPNIGELNTVITQALLNEICNPFLPS